MIARRDHAAAAAFDTVADDCVMDFLGDINEALWILHDVQRSDQTAFRHAARRQEHVNELRRLLHRLHWPARPMHRTLLEWEGDCG